MSMGPAIVAPDPGAHVIPSLLEKILSPDPEVVVWGSGNQTRSFIHAHDIARGLALVTELHAKADPVNIGSSEEIRLCDLVNSLMELSGVHKPVRFDTGIPEGATRKAADISKLGRITSKFRPAISWQSGLRELVDACLLEPISLPGQESDALRTGINHEVHPGHDHLVRVGFRRFQSACL